MDGKSASMRYRSVRGVWAWLAGSSEAKNSRKSAARSKEKSGATEEDADDAAAVEEASDDCVAAGLLPNAKKMRYSKDMAPLCSAPLMLCSSAKAKGDGSLHT